MIRKIFSVYDCKSELYLNPFFMSTKGEALRAFGDIANDPQSQIGKHPCDFSLMEIGSFDDAKGMVMPMLTPLSLGVAIEFKAQDKQMQLPIGEMPGNN